MKSFFGKHESYTKEGLELDREIDAALKPIFDKWTAEGYTVREIAHMAHGTVISLECYRVVKAAMDSRKKEKAAAAAVTDDSTTND